MELFFPPWWPALLAIVLIDLVLAGDNVILIALAARNLPPHLQKKAIAWGAAGAIVVRSVMTVGVVWLLKIPGLLLVLAGAAAGVTRCLPASRRNCKTKPGRWTASSRRLHHRGKACAT